MRISFKYDASETAPESKKEVKGRIHFLPYSGEKNKDLYAVAAKAFKENQTPKLGILEKSRFIIIKDNTSETTYKINRRSLSKRLGISEDQIKEISKLDIEKRDDKLKTMILNEMELKINKDFKILEPLLKKSSLDENDKRRIKGVFSHAIDQPLLVKKLLEQKNVNGVIKESLFTVLNQVDQRLIPDDLKLKINAHGKKTFIQDLKQYKPPSPLSERELQIYTNFKKTPSPKQFKLQFGKDIKESITNDFVEKTAKLGLDAFLNSLPLSFGLSKGPQIEMNQFIEDFGRIVEHGSFEKRSQCMSQLSAQLGQSITGKLESLSMLDDPEVMQTTEGMIRSIVDEIDKILFKDVNSETDKKELLKIHLNMLGNKDQLQLIDACLLCKYALDLKDEDFSKIILNIDSRSRAMAFKFLPNDELKRKALEVLEAKHVPIKDEEIISEIPTIETAASKEKPQKNGIGELPKVIRRPLEKMNLKEIFQEGLRYANGDGVPQDVEYAIKCFEYKQIFMMFEGGQKHLENLCLQKVIFYEKQGNNEKAMEYFKKAEAMYLSSRLDLMEQNLQFYKRAQDFGSKIGKEKLESAIRELRTLAEQGNDPARRILFGWLLFKGEFMEKDVNRAIGYLKSVAEGGQNISINDRKDANVKLGDLYKIEKKHKESKKYYQEAKKLSVENEELKPK